MSLVAPSIIFVLGGDHGQGAFRMVVKLIYRYQNGEKTSTEYGLGDIECKKDTATLLKDTIIPVLEPCFKKIIKYKYGYYNEIVYDGEIKVYEDVKDKQHEFKKISVDLTEDYRKEGLLKQVIPFHCFVSGNLAFYAMLLRMENHEGAWCIYCTLSKQEWTKCSDVPLKERILEFNKNITSKFLGGHAEKGKGVSGVVESLLLGYIEPRRYILPVLHIKIGIINKIVSEMITTLEYLFEPVPKEVTDLRKEESILAVDVKELNNFFTDWIESDGEDMEEMKERKQANLDILTKKPFFNFDALDIAEIKETNSNLKHNIEVLVANKKRLENQTQQKTEEWKLVSKKLKEKYSSLLNISIKTYVKDDIEKILSVYNINPSAYHGGNLQGNNCINFGNNTDKINKDIKDWMVSQSIYIDLDTEVLLNLKNKLEKLMNAASLYNVVFSLLNTPYISITNQTYEELK